MSAISTRSDFSLGGSAVETTANLPPSFLLAERPRLSISIAITFEPHAGASATERDSVQWSYRSGPNTLEGQRSGIQESTISPVAAPMPHAAPIESSQTMNTPLSPSPAYSATWRLPETPSPGGPESITAYPQPVATSLSNPSTAPPPYSPVRHLPEYRSAEIELEDSQVYRWPPRRGSDGSAVSRSWTINSDTGEIGYIASSGSPSIYELEDASPVSPAVSHAPSGSTGSYFSSPAPSSSLSSPARSANSSILLGTPSTGGLSLSSVDNRAELEADVPVAESASPSYRTPSSPAPSRLGPSSLRRRSIDCDTGSDASRAPRTGSQSGRSSVVPRRSRGFKHFLRRLAERATAHEVL